MLETLQDTSPRASRTLRALVVVAAVAVLTLPAIYLSSARGVMASDGREKAEFLPPPSGSEEAILAVLEKPTEMDFVETPVADAADYLRDLHQIPIHIDTKALAEADLDEATPLTCWLNDVSLKSALHLLLRPKDLTYVVQDEVLLITTEKAAAQAMFTRTYPVGDLVDRAEKKPGDELIEVITTTVQPNTWDELGGYGSLEFVPRAESLVIRQTRDVHDDVLALLRALREAHRRESK